MSEFKSVAKIGAVPDGQGRCFTVDGRMIGVYLLDGQYFAINDLCPHMGASLASGWLDRETSSVSCPWHAWRFSVKDGTWLDNPKIRTDCYEVRVEGDVIQVRIPDRRCGPESGESGATGSNAGPSCCDPS